MPLPLSRRLWRATEQRIRLARPRTLNAGIVLRTTRAVRLHHLFRIV